MLKGYTDEHVVFGLVQALRQRGMDVVRVQDCGREQADDADLPDEALANERVMLTNDTDFWPWPPGGTTGAIRADFLLAAAAPIDWPTSPKHRS
jgi:hypothetical protein